MILERTTEVDIYKPRLAGAAPLNVATSKKHDVSGEETF